MVKMIASVPYCSEVETLPATLSISADPAADIEAGDPTMTICQGEMVSLNGMIITANTSAIWSTSGDGLFANGMPSTSVMNTTYTPGASDLSNGMVTLTLTGNDPLGACDADVDNIIVTIGNGAILNTVPANGQLTRCEGSDATFRVNFTSTSSQVPTIVWQRDGVDIVDDAKYDLLDGGSATQSRLRVNDVTDLDEGDYTVSVTYPGCDAETRTFTLTVEAGPTAEVGGPYAAICAEGTIMLDGTVGGSATTGSWSSTTGGTFSDIYLAGADATYTPSGADITAGSVVLTLTSNGAVPGCPVAVETVTIDIYSITPNAISPATQTQCDGEVVTVNATWTEVPTTLAATASWEVSTNGGTTYLPFAGTSVVNSVGQSVLTFTATSAMSGNRYRAVVAAGACTVSTSPMTLTVNGPVVFDTHPASVLNECQSTTEMSFTALGTNNGNGVVTYRWQYSINGTTWTNVATSVDGYSTTTLTVDSGDGAAWPTIGSATGKYYRLAANLPGCSNFYHSDAAQFTISNDAAPYVTVPADGIQCKGTIANLTGSISGSATSATWTTNGSGTISTPPADYANATYTPGIDETGEVTFTLTSNDPAGVCPAAVESFKVTYIDVNAGADINVCIDGSELDPISLAGMVTGMDNPTVAWNDGTSDFSNDLDGTYTPSSTSPITLTLTSNGCSDNVDIIFNENITNVTLSGAVEKNVCVGSGTSFRVNFDPATGVTRTWKYSEDGLYWNDLVIAAPFSVSSPGSSDTQLNLLSSGSNSGASSEMQGFYKVVLTNGECMIESDPFKLIVSEITSASLNSGDDLAICETATDVTVMGEAVSSDYNTASYRLRYRIDGGTWTNLGGSSTTPSFTFSSGLAWDAALHSSGMTVELLLRVTLGGCTFDSDPIAFTRDEAPTVTAGSDDIICETGTATLAGMKGGSTLSITWSSDKAGNFDDATSLAAVYTPGEPGIHTLTITSDDPLNSCPAATATVEITVEDQVIVNAGDDQAVCQSEGTMDVILNGSATPSDADVTWTASSGTFVNENILGATYTPDGSTQQVTLTLTPTQVVCPAIPDQVVISLGDGIDLISYTPGDATTTGSRTVCDGGSTTFRVDFDPTVLATFQWQINGTPLTIANASSFGIGGWSVTNTDTYAQLTLTGITVDANGHQISLEVTDRGCSATFGDFTLNVNGPVTFSTQPIDQEVCATETMATFTGVASNAGAGGTPTYQWQYFDGSTWVNVPNSVAGYNGTSLYLTDAATTIWPDAGSSVDLRLKATIPVCGATYSEIVTLTVTNSSCDQVPDFEPLIIIYPSSIIGPSQFFFTVKVDELNGAASSSPVVVRIPKNNKVSFTYDSNASLLGGFLSVSNADWTYTSNSFFHFWTYTGTFLSNGTSTFGAMANFDPIGQDGEYIMTSNIVNGSGGDSNNANNVDDDVISYKD